MRVGGEKLDLPDNIDLYDILGLDKSAKPDIQTIKKAYNQLTLKYHPDRHTGEDKNLAQQQFILVSRAYTVLSNDSLRKEYDSLISCKGFKEYDKNYRNSSKDQPDSPFTSFTAVFNSPKIQEECLKELRWINDIINSSYQLFQQIKMAQEKTNKLNKYAPVLPVPASVTQDTLNNIRKPITDADFDALLHQLMSQKSKSSKKISKESLPLDKYQQKGDLLPVPYEIEVSATLRQYLLKRRKKIKVKLPNEITRVLTVNIRLEEQFMNIEDTGELVSIKIKIEDQNSKEGIWSLHPKQQDRKNTCLIFKSNAKILNDLVVTGPLTELYIFKLQDCSSIHMYYGTYDVFDLIVYSNNNDTLDDTELQKEVHNLSENNPSEANRYTIKLYPFKTLEELLVY